MPTSRNSPSLLKRKPPAKKQWKAVQSKPSETAATNKTKVIALLKKQYPDAKCALNFETPFQLLVATILSAQCTDERVNKVTLELFKKYPDTNKMAQAHLADVEELIRSTNFYKNKSKNLISCAKSLVEKHRSEVPKDLDALVGLAGVGRKTANVVLGNAFGIASGIVVDTHVARLSNRLGWTKKKDPVEIEKDLLKFVEQQDWIQLPHWLIHHGRTVCKARSPDCEKCFLTKVCPKNPYKI